MGRPRKDDRRDRQLNIRLTDGEFASIAAHATARGETPTEYGRDRVLAGEVAALPSPALIAAKHEERLLHIQLRRLGNLLNQLVRHLHQTGEMLPDAGPLLRDIRAILTGRREP